MTLDGRGRRAGEGFRRAIDDLTTSDPGRASLERFDTFRRRKRRNQRVGAGVLAGALAVAAIILVSNALPTDEREPTGPLGGGGDILYGDWDADAQRAEWYTVAPNGSNARSLGLSTTCAVWTPDATGILITNDGSAPPLRPATVEPDGTGLELLDATQDPDLNLGCGDVSPDGERIVLEGIGQDGHPELDGIYSVRASDGSDLVRLVRGPVSPPRYSPDGATVSYFDIKAGATPTGAGALFVIPAGGGAPVQITPWGFAFEDHEWSPDGRWIVFQRPYGQLYLVRPDGSDLHRIPLELPSGAGALNPSWSPDGAWITFSLQQADDARISIVRPDGTGLRDVVHTSGAQLQSPDWGS